MRQILSLLVTSFAVNGAWAATTTANGCEQYMLNRNALMDSIQLSAGSREDLRISAENKIDKLAVYVPVRTVSKIRTLLEQRKQIHDKGKYNDAVGAALGSLQTQIDELIVATIQHRDNRTLFKPLAATDRPINVSTNSPRYLELVRTIDLELRIAMAVYATAYQHSLVIYTESSYHDFFEADVMFDRYRNQYYDHRALERERTGPYAKLTVGQLNSEIEKLSAERKALWAKYLDQPILPDAIKAVVNEMLLPRSVVPERFAFRDTVEAVEEKVNASAEHPWNLRKLWSVGGMTVSLTGSELSLDDKRAMLINYIVMDNRRALMPEADFQRLSEVEETLKRLDLISGQGGVREYVIGNH